MPLGAEYECIRWARRMPRAAAAVFFEGTAAPEVVAPPGSDPHNPHQEVEVLYPLVLLLLPPDQLCAQLAGGAMLRPLRDAMRGAHPECTLMVGCVGLERHLVREEQVPGGVGAGGGCSLTRACLPSTSSRMRVVVCTVCSVFALCVHVSPMCEV